MSVSKNIPIFPGLEFEIVERYRSGAVKSQVESLADPGANPMIP